VSLTSGRGPLSKDPAGWFVPPVAAGTFYVEPFRRRVRGVTGDRVLVDSERVLLVHRAGEPPAYAFPSDDAAGVPSEPEPAAPGHVRVAWDAVDGWFEEEERVRLHPRNPYHRVDCLKTNRRLRVEVEGGVLVDTTDTVAVFETALEPRLYVRPEHVAAGALVKSTTTTFCPYKGTATYWTAELDRSRVEDVAWSYEDPLPEAERVRGHLSFDADRVTVLASFPP
jgi:uncharacterized protein (DUF427 family)